MFKKVAGFIVAVLALAFMAVNAIPMIHPSQVIGLQPGSVQYGIQQALLEKTGTVILQQGSKYVFGWTLEQGFAFAGFDTVGRSAISIKMSGNIVNVKNAQQFVNYLEMNGWKVVASAEVPAAIKVAAGVANGSKVAAWMTAAARNCTIILFPASMVDSFTIVKAGEIQ